MKYYDGSIIKLGDIVTVPVPEEREKARVVMLGDTYEHLDIDEGFLVWVKKDKILEKTSVVVEWIDSNPFAHDDPQYAPVGNYMFTTVDEYLRKIA
jgi:hypothetical protein